MITYGAHFHSHISRHLVNISYHFTYFPSRPQLHRHLYMNDKNLNLLLTPEFQMFPKLLAQQHPLDATKAHLVNMPKATVTVPPPSLSLFQVYQSKQMAPVSFQFCQTGIQGLYSSCCSFHLCSVSNPLPILLAVLLKHFTSPVISTPVATIPNRAVLLYQFSILHSAFPTATLAFSVFVSLK